MKRNAEVTADIEPLRLDSLRLALKGVQDDLGLPQLVALLSIALEPGLSVGELAERTGAPQQSASRYVSVLLGRYREGATEAASDPFITQEVSRDAPRRRALYLAPRGNDLVAKLLDALSSRLQG